MPDGTEQVTDLEGALHNLDVEEEVENDWLTNQSEVNALNEAYPELAGF